MKMIRRTNKMSQSGVMLISEMVLERRPRWACALPAMSLSRSWLLQQTVAVCELGSRMHDLGRGRRTRAIAGRQDQIDHELRVLLDLARLARQHVEGDHCRNRDKDAD